MHVIVVGAGAAGLGAAWRLMEDGVQVTVLEAADHAGGRCHSVFWHDDWWITGAFAFTSVEENLIEQSRKLGIYRDEDLEDLSGMLSYPILIDRKRVEHIADFQPLSILLSKALPLGEKLALARVLPKLAKQMLRSDWRDPTPAAEFDHQTAADYFRRASPAFIDYVIEPVMQFFNGFADDDLSLAWLLWILGGQPWSRSWWSFKERGVGRLTYEMARQLDEKPDVRIELNTAVQEIRHTGDMAEVDVTLAGAPVTLKADAVVCAVPGCLVNQLVLDLDEDYRTFFDAVRYGALHLSYFLVDLPEADVPESLILPTVDGFHTVAHYFIQPLGGRNAMIHAEMKGEASARAVSQTDEEVQDLLWADIVAATPQLADCRIHDFLLLRNDIAIVKPYVGYIRQLERFRSLPSLSRLAFAGDYLITSTVGQAHYTGLQAAEQILSIGRAT